jgi:uncharacterized integral membrane protein
MNETKPTESEGRKVLGRSAAFALVIICIVLLASLIGALAVINDKNVTISSLNAQIYQLNSNATQLQSNVSSLTSTVVQQRSQLENLQRLKNLADQVFYSHPVYSDNGQWWGSWDIVATFNKDVVSGGKTPNFEIYSDFRIWRLNFTIPGDLSFHIIQDVGSQKIILGMLSVANEENRTIYYFEYSVMFPLTYYIEFSGSFAGNWTMTIEELNH